MIVGEFLVLSKPTVVEFKEKEITTLIKDVVTLINTQAIMNNIQIVEEYRFSLAESRMRGKSIKTSIY